jgi:hypothetical protein
MKIDIKGDKEEVFNFINKYPVLVDCLNECVNKVPSYFPGSRLVASLDINCCNIENVELVLTIMVKQEFLRVSKIMDIRTLMYEDWLLEVCDKSDSKFSVDISFE